MHRNFICGYLIFASSLFNFQTTKVSAQMKERFYSGMADASAAVALGKDEFIVANDEDNDLRIFTKDTPEAKQIVKLSEVFKDKIADGEGLEKSIEGAALLGDTIFWIGSHSTSKKGKFRPARHRLFAVSAKRVGDGKYKLTPVGKIYANLIADLEKDARFDRFKLKEAKEISPKALGGLSIEGLTAAPDGALLIGFRNPLSDGTIKDGFLIGGKALVVKLLNPTEVIYGKTARFDAPFGLDLGGFGIRSIEYSEAANKYLIAAGTYHENEETPMHKVETSRLYKWSGKADEAPVQLTNSDLAGLNIESAFFIPAKKNQVILLSDDGSAEKNRFRAVTIKLEQF